MIMQKTSIYQLKKNIKMCLISIKSKTKELEELESADQALLQRLDLMKFQYEELEEASLKRAKLSN